MYKRYVNLTKISVCNVYKFISKVFLKLYLIKDKEISGIKKL